MKEEKLATLLAKKRGFFEAILDLSETEADLCFTNLIPVLEQKKVLLSCIEEIDEQLLPYKSSLHALSFEVQEELEEIRKVIKRILDLDTLNQQKRKQEALLDDETLLP